MARPKTNLTYEEKVAQLEAKISEAEEAAKAAQAELAELKKAHKMEQAKEIADLLEGSSKSLEDVKRFLAGF